MSKQDVFHDTEHAEIRYDEQLDAVYVDWKKTASGEDYREVLNLGLKLVQRYGVTNWLADCRDVGPVAPADQEWTVDEWFPRTSSTGLTQMADIRSERFVRQVSVDDVETEVGDSLTHRYFDSTDDARDWLFA